MSSPSSVSRGRAGAASKSPQSRSDQVSECTSIVPCRLCGEVGVQTKNAETRVSGDRSGQACYALSSPENIARHRALRVLGEALGKNLDKSPRALS